EPGGRMRVHQLLYFTSAIAIVAGPAVAADQLKFGKAPAWVVPQSIPAPPAGAATAPTLILLSDQQVHFEAGKSTAYVETALKIQTAEGLAAGNVSLPWNPATQTLTVNKFEIRRGSQVIDILASGQTFTTIRRESNLELAMFDGMLTANIQPEGLQEGDIIVLATTIQESDPILKGHAAASFAMWNGAPFQLAHSRIEWPAGMKLFTRHSFGLPVAKSSEHNGRRILELTAHNVQPVTPPAGAPARFRIGRIGEASDFQSWAEVAELMVPLYREAAVILPSGPLHAEIEKIRAVSNDPKERAAKALELAQSRVRYVALLMGQGGYTPASAEATWSRRYGDCKAKTALLLASLHALGIEAEPVLANLGNGDAVADRLPMLGHFNHVLVRARIAGKNYWLDGTRSGDAGIDEIPVPNFGWGLPVTAGAKLVKIVPQPFDRPAAETVIEMDASGGVKAPVPATVEVLFRGDAARALNQAYASITPAQLDEALRQKWKKEYDFITIASNTYKYDKPKGELLHIVKGDIKMDWRDGWFTVPGSSLAYDPDFERASGPQQQAPFAVAYPHYESHRVKLRLPAGFSASQKLPIHVKESLAGMAYERSASISGDVLTLQKSERAEAPELRYQDALAARARLRTLWQEDVYLRLSDDYRPTARDIAALASEEPSSAKEHIKRGLTYLNATKYDEAIADFSKAIALDPSDPWARANRALSYSWKRDFASAQKDIAAAEALDAGNPVLRKGKGLIAHFKGDNATAVTEFSAALKVDPQDAFALFNRANAQLLLGDLTAAEADLDAYDKLRPGEVGSTFTRAEIAASRGDYKSAVDGFTETLEVKPNDPVALARRSTMFEAMGDDERALGDAERAIRGQSLNSDMRMLRARIFKKRGQPEKAAAEADQFLKEWGKHEFVQVTAAEIYDLAGMKGRAMKAFDRALAIKQVPYIYVLRGHTRPITDEPGRLSDYQEALKLDPNDLGGLLSLAAELNKAGKPQDALVYYDRAIKASPQRKDIGVSRALVLAQLGRVDEAEKEIANYRKELKASIEFNNLCWAKATAGLMLNSALDDCREALRLAPDEPAYLDSLGMVFLRLNRFDESIAAYDKAIRKRPNQADSLMGRALAHAAKGDLAKAQADASGARAANARIDEVFLIYGLKFDNRSKLTSNQ
ncbi:MAG: tetratricopeptide repeat protein, partial [Sphingomicrobium sp.]